MPRPEIKTYLSLFRVHQYLKNLLIGAPLFFGGRLLDPEPLTATLWAFVCFSLTSSTVYIINDLKDLEYDRAHPEKRKRPLAAGLISPGRAIFWGLALFFPALGLGLFLLKPAALGLICLYLLLNLAYSFGLKHYAVVDVLMIASFFVLRVFVGGLAASIPVSHWLVLMAFLLALFLALAKRRDDLVLADGTSGHRPSMDGYNLEFVTAGLIIMAAVTVVCYILYTLSPEVMAKHGTEYLYLTVIWVVAGLLRYLQVTLVEHRSGAPTRLLLRDRFLLGVVVLWALTMFVMLYRFG